MPTPRRPSKGSPRITEATSLFQPRDVRAYLAEKAALIAPADVEAALARRQEALDKAATAAPDHDLFQRQVAIAFQLLDDHLSGAAPQIPYSVVSLLTVAMFYLLSPMDLIPDFIPGIGLADDALVLELACEMGAAGLERYCIYKDIPVASVLGGSQGREGAGHAPSRPRSKPRPKSSPKRRPQ